ncbi:hypothetical protein [Planktothricoides raciborskii]|uniref:Uncharacterized protein n=1 Tax=Planktothricoides raciborskii FACHB-1370 TaxID=2949576 RepID=A0ABR8EFS6_9CYAN|nr:hypothetical protein [Planktothricoides raciborskii]MBD2545643.1 hypothetical protein [Planktothricoides raciborskii FACHB-1370]MBD2585259.1 hypothetical protein [Planktothricoides raciborskii FACHB-1261]
MTPTTAVDPYKILVGFNRLVLLAREFIPWRLIGGRLWFINLKTAVYLAADWQATDLATDEMTVNIDRRY